MIVKIKSFKMPRYQRLLEYILGDERRLYDTSNKTFIITHNLKGRTINGWVAQMNENEVYRKRKRRDSVLLTHEIISFHQEDSKHITIEQLEEIARTYIRMRSSKAVAVAVPHFDKEHVHVHLCVCGLEYRSGKTLRMSKEGFQKLKKDIQGYQMERFPLLSRSTPDHGKKGNLLRSDKEYQLKLRTGRASKKDQLIETLESCYRASCSTHDFYQRITQSGLKTYDRAGKTTGVILDNLKFRFNRLGFTPDRLKQLNRSSKRGHELREVRGEKRKTITRHK